MSERLTDAELARELVKRRQEQGRCFGFAWDDPEGQVRYHIRVEVAAYKVYQVPEYPAV